MTNSITALLIGTLLSPLSGIGQNNAGPTGTSFHLAFLDAYSDNDLPNTKLRLMIQAAQATAGYVTQPQRGYSQPFTVVPGTATIISLPLSYMDSLPGLVGNSGLWVTTALPVSVQLYELGIGTHDATAVLPDGALGNDHIIMSHPGIPSTFIQAPSEFIVVATEDSTALTIQLSNDPIPLQLVLNANETFLWHAPDNFTDLTGTRITSSGPYGCGRIAVFTGTSCAFVPDSCTTCDLLMDQLPPLSGWGTAYFSMPPDNAIGYGLKVVAVDSGTTVNLNGNVLNLTAGQSQMITGLTGLQVITSNLPIGVAQFMLGKWGCAGYGDPSMLILQPLSNGSTRAVFETPNAQYFLGHRIGLATDSANVGAVLLDGAVIPAAQFQGYPGYPGQVFMDLAVDSGSHVVEAPLPFVGHLYGWNFIGSYDSGSGSSHIPLSAAIGDTLICHAGGPLLLQAPAGFAQPLWFTDGHLTDTLSTDPQFNPTIVSDSVLVLRDAGAPCSLHRFRVETPLNTTLTTTAVPSIVCAGDMVSLEASMAPAVVATTQWAPDSVVTSPFQQNSTATPLVDTWFTFRVHSPSMCWSLADSVFVQVVQEPPAFNIVQNGTELCAGPVGPWTYQWFLNGDSITGANGQCFDMLVSGSYSVVLDAGGDCTSSDAGNFVVNALQEITPYITWSVASGGDLLVSVPPGTRTLRLFDRTGRAIMVADHERVADGRVNFGTVARGIYVLQVEGDQWLRSVKLVVF